MKNIKQIRLIQNALTKEKEKHLIELSKLAQSIDKKISTISRMIVYQNEYTNTEHLRLSRSIPALTKNLYAFSEKMTDLIKQAEAEVLIMQKSKESILQSIEKIDNKMKLMDLFEDKAKMKALLSAEKQEQVMMDDLASIKHTRGEEYE